MAAAGILYIALLALWLAAGAAGGWPLPVSAAIGVVVVALVVWAGQRLKVADGESAAPFARFVPGIAFSVSRAPGRWRDALAVAASAVGVRPTTPAFVRLKLRPADPVGAASVVTAMTGAPGVATVDADAGSLLAHVLVEPDVNVSALQAVERGALRQAGQAP